MKRDRWSEQDVLGLPSGEQDYFERKSGALLAETGFHTTLAKALCAFANSGGGHVLLGVRDDGSFDGVKKAHKGRTPTREWLEQIIPDLLDYSLQDFRVHEVVTTDESTVPDGHVVIVIDVGDSALAPHQSRRDKVYYRRVGSHSKPAPHFDIERLRSRLTGPNLEAKLEGVDFIDARLINDSVFVETALSFRVSNSGRVAAYEWAVKLGSLSNCLEDWVSDYIFDKTKFPPPRRQNNIALSGRTILPSLEFITKEPFGFYLRHEHEDGPGWIAAGASSNYWSSDKLNRILSLVIPEEMKLESRTVSETRIGEVAEGSLAPFFDHGFARKIYKTIQGSKAKVSLA